MKSIKITNFYDDTVVSEINVSDTLLNIDYDAIKFTDDDLYTYEGRKCSVEMLFNQTINNIFENADDSNFLYRNFVEYEDNLEQRLPEQTNFLKYYVEIIENTNLVFAGVFDYDSFIKDPESYTIKFEIVDIQTLFLDNINNSIKLQECIQFVISKILESEDTSGFVSGQINRASRTPSVFTKHIVDFYCQYSIDIRYRSINNIVVSDDLFVNPEKIQVSSQYAVPFINSQLPTREYIVDKCRTNFNESIADNILDESQYSVSGVSNSWYRRTEIVNGSVELISVKIFSSRSQNSLVIFGLYNSYSDLQNGLKTNIVNKDIPVVFSIWEGNGEEEVLEWIASIDETTIVQKYIEWVALGGEYGNDEFDEQTGTKFSKVLVNGNANMLNIVSNYTSLYSFEFQLPQKIGITTFTNIIGIYTVQQDAEKISFYGEYIPLFSFCYNKEKKLILGSGNLVTDGLFNGDKFSASDFFKFTLIASLKTISIKPVIGKSSIETVDIVSFIRNEEAISPDVFINDKFILSFSQKQKLILVDKIISELNYSETDNHYLFVYIKTLLLYIFGKRLNETNISILLTNAYSFIESGDIVQIKNKLYLVNSIKSKTDDLTIDLDIISLDKIHGTAKK